jgi:hypothetical protein
LIKRKKKNTAAVFSLEDKEAGAQQSHPKADFFFF